MNNTKTFQIRTPNGFVGRYGMTEDLQDDMPQSHGYTYHNRLQAMDVAERFGGELVEIEFDGWRIITKTP